jgi:hypothetical protein
MVLVYLSQSLQADCLGHLLRDQLKHPAVAVVIRGRVTQIHEVRRNPAIQQVTFLVDRVWKGNERPTFEVYNVPLDWTPLTVIQTPGGGGVTGGTSGGGSRPFQLNESYVVVARRLTSRERGELGIAANEERFGTSYCRDGSRTIQEAEINREFEHIGPGREPQ